MTASNLVRNNVVYLYPISSHGHVEYSEGDTHKVKHSNVSVHEVDGDQRKCSILSTQVSQSELGCSSAPACGANVTSNEDFSAAFSQA